MRFVELVDRLGDAATVQWSTRPHDEVIEEGLRCRSELIEKFYGPSVARREALVDAHRSGKLRSDELPRDLITAMLLHDDASWDDTLLLREATLYLIAATRTTAHAVPHGVQHLHEWLLAHPDDRARVSDREFLGAVAGEVLRLHPPSPALVRRATRDVTVASSGRSVATGERLALLFGPANRDREVFGEDADTFDPGRALPAGRKRWGLSFGAGDHLCMGRALVTGMAGRADEEPTGGTLTMILEALARAGAQPDPDNPPQLVTTSLYAAYASYPIVLGA